MSGISVNISLDTKGLKKLRKALGKNGYVKVGILGNGASRDDETVNNAELGVIQEFGSVSNNIPPRSFLRMSIETHKEDFIEVAETKAFKKAFSAGDMNRALELVGFKAEAIVDEAFTSGGFGVWPANKPATIARKGSSKPLIDTGQLRRAISSEVVNGEEN